MESFKEVLTKAFKDRDWKTIEEIIISERAKVKSIHDASFFKIKSFWETEIEPNYSEKVKVKFDQKLCEIYLKHYIKGTV